MKAAETGVSRSFLAVAFLLTALTAAYVFVGDSTWWGECLTVWPPFVWCAVLLPRLALLGARKKFRELSGALFLIVIFLGLTIEWPSFFRTARTVPTRGNTQLRIVSWNVAGGMPLDDLSKLDRPPDVAFLQEIGIFDERSVQAGSFKGYHWEGSFDPGVLSRFPLRRLTTESIGPWQPPLMVEATLPDGRTILMVTVRLVLPAFVVAVASGESPLTLKAKHTERTDQFRLVAALIEKRSAETHPAATILCGDFNTPGGIQSLLPLTARLRDIWPESGIGWGGTMTAELPVSRIDQCWVSPNVEALRATVERGRSDHRMLVVDLTLP